MQAPSGNKPVTGGVTSRLAELGIALPAPPTPLGAYVESSDTGNLLFLSGVLPLVNRKLAISGRLGETLSVREGQQAARIASLNALAAAKQHLGSLDRLKKLVKLTVLIASTQRFLEHAPVADGASDLFVQISWQRDRPRSVGVWSPKPTRWRASHSGHDFRNRNRNPRNVRIMNYDTTGKQ